MSVTLTHSSNTTYRRGYITAASNQHLLHALKSLEITHPSHIHHNHNHNHPPTSNNQTTKQQLKMPKSTGPLQTHLFGNTTNSTPGMADQPTVAADKIGEKKGTDAIPQSVCPFCTPPLPSPISLQPTHPSIPGVVY
jgi:hypothetical protein